MITCVFLSNFQRNKKHWINNWGFFQADQLTEEQIAGK